MHSTYEHERCGIECSTECRFVNTSVLEHDWQFVQQLVNLCLVLRIAHQHVGGGHGQEHVVHLAYSHQLRSLGRGLCSAQLMQAL